MCPDTAFGGLASNGIPEVNSSKGTSQVILPYLLLISTVNTG